MKEFIKFSRLAILALAVPIFFGCNPQSDPTLSNQKEVGFPKLGSMNSPVDLSAARLAPTERVGPFLGEALFDNWDGSLITKEGNARTDLRPKSGILLHHYPNVTVDGHFRASGTFVCYDKKKNAFFLFGDCVMGHLDPPLGPFDGDPRELLVDEMKGNESVK